MQNLIDGISKFHRYNAGFVQPLLAHLAVHGQRPQAMMITCADSRIMPEGLTQADPGDLFMIRNIGNLVPGAAEADTSVGAAIDYALLALEVKDIIVMGHSGCGAMAALMKGESPSSHIAEWLRHGGPSLDQHKARLIEDDLPEVDLLSQANVLVSLDNLRAYPSIRERSDVRLHAWWFDVHNARVKAYDEVSRRFATLGMSYALI